MVTKSTSSKAPASTSTATAGASDDADVRVRNARRAERAQKIAKMQQDGHPFAGPALAMHKKVCDMEDALNRERTMLMAVLKQVK